MRPKWFRLEELVYPEIFKARGEACWELLDSRALVTLDALRDKFGPTTVNNWHADGQYKESGLRSFDTTTGAKYSQHRFGRAFDCKFRHATPEEVQAYVLSHRDEFPLLTTIENAADTVTWLHFDCRLNADDSIRIIEP